MFVLSQELIQLKEESNYNGSNKDYCNETLNKLQFFNRRESEDLEQVLLILEKTVSIIQSSEENKQIIEFCFYLVYKFIKSSKNVSTEFVVRIVDCVNKLKIKLLWTLQNERQVFISLIEDILYILTEVSFSMKASIDIAESWFLVYQYSDVLQFLINLSYISSKVSDIVSFISTKKPEFLFEYLKCFSSIENHSKETSKIISKLASDIPNVLVKYLSVVVQMLNAPSSYLRITILESFLYLIQVNNELASKLVTLMNDYLLDANASVRQSVLKCLSSLIQSNTSVSPTRNLIPLDLRFMVYSSCFSRCSDKSFLVRKDALKFFQVLIATHPFRLDNMFELNYEFYLEKAESESSAEHQRYYKDAVKFIELLFSVASLLEQELIYSKIKSDCLESLKFLTRFYKIVVTSSKQNNLLDVILELVWVKQREMAMIFYEMYLSPSVNFLSSENKSEKMYLHECLQNLLRIFKDLSPAKKVSFSVLIHSIGESSPSDPKDPKRKKKDNQEVDISIDQDDNPDINLSVLKRKLLKLILSCLQTDRRRSYANFDYSLYQSELFSIMNLLITSPDQITNTEKQEIFRCCLEALSSSDLKISEIALRCLSSFNDDQMSQEASRKILDILIDSKTRTMDYFSFANCAVGYLAKTSNEPIKTLDFVISAVKTQITRTVGLSSDKEFLLSKLIFLLGCYAQKSVEIFERIEVFWKFQIPNGEESNVDDLSNVGCSAEDEMAMKCAMIREKEVMFDSLISLILPVIVEILKSSKSSFLWRISENCLLKFMLVSSLFTERNFKSLLEIRSIYKRKVIESSQSSEKEDIAQISQVHESPRTEFSIGFLVICSDICVLFPNVIEKYLNDTIFMRLDAKGYGVEVESRVLIMIHLVLNGTVKLRGKQMYDLAALIVNKEHENMMKSFFSELAQKDQIIIYNNITDFSVIDYVQERKLTLEEFKSVVKFVFSFILDKQVDGVIEKLMMKLKNYSSKPDIENSDIDLIFYCFTCLNISNEKSLIKIGEHFQIFKLYLVHDFAYQVIKGIFSASSGSDSSSNNLIEELLRKIEYARQESTNLSQTSANEMQKLEASSSKADVDKYIDEARLALTNLKLSQQEKKKPAIKKKKIASKKISYDKEDEEDEENYPSSNVNRVRSGRRAVKTEN